MSTHGQFANPITQPQSPCKLSIQPPFGGRFFIQIPTPGRQANLGLRLYNRPSAVAFVIGLRTTIRETAEERFHTLARGWLAYPVTPTHAHLPPKSGCRDIHRGTFFLGCKLTVDGGRFRMATKQKKRDNTLRVVSPYNSI